MNQLIQLDSQTDQQSEQYYDSLMSYIRDHLMAFYQHYADENGLSLSQTMTRVSKWDITQWQAAIDSLGNTSDWPQEAKDRIKAQSTIGSINKHFLIGSILALGIIHLTVRNQKMIDDRLKLDGKDEIKHVAKALKMSRKSVKKATSIITQASTRQQWSSNLWVDSDKLAADVQNLVNQTLKHGLSLDDLPRLLNKHANPNQFRPGQSIADRVEQMNYETKRLVRTESARLKYETDLVTYRMKGVKWVKWLTEPGACSKCQGIAAGGPYAIDDVPEIPGDSHPNCRCSIVPYVKANETLNSPSKTSTSHLDTAVKESELLPGKESPVIAKEKFTKYALDFDNPSGKNKAVVFKSALGYTKENYESLSSQIREGILENPAVAGTKDRFGQRYSVDIPVKGPNGQTHNVRTAWIVDNEHTRLISTYVKE